MRPPVVTRPSGRYFCPVYKVLPASATDPVGPHSPGKSAAAPGQGRSAAAAVTGAVSEAAPTAGPLSVIPHEPGQDNPPIHDRPPFHDEYYLVVRNLFS